MRPTKETGILTVADVREGRDENVVLFNERQQIFELTSSKAALSGRLREALDRGLPVKAVLNPRRGTLDSVESPSDRELREFEKGRILLDRPEKPFKVDLDRIDPTTFNIVDHYLKVPTLHQGHPELQGREGHLRLLRGPVVQPTGAVRNRPLLHPVPVRA